MASGILLQAGTNEMELLVFRNGHTYFGINVAKVREIIQRQPTIRVPMAPPAIEGSFVIRDEVLSLVNLGSYLEMESVQDEKHEGLIIIIELNGRRCGVLVDAVERIHRLNWDQIEPPGDYLEALNVPVTAVAQVEGRVVLILDFESLLGGLLGIQGMDENVVAAHADPAGYGALRVLIADDSPTIRKTVARILEGVGFQHLHLCADGQEAWETIEKTKDGDDRFDIVLSDIEMPRMDGLHLTARIKQDEVLKATPVVLFSSLISTANRNKGEAVGADAQITKFKQAELLAAIDGCLENIQA